jgi:hypothetical protein
MRKGIVVAIFLAVFLFTIGSVSAFSGQSVYNPETGETTVFEAVLWTTVCAETRCGIDPDDGYNYGDCPSCCGACVGNVCGGSQGGAVCGEGDVCRNEEACKGTRDFCFSHGKYISCVREDNPSSCDLHRCVDFCGAGDTFCIGFIGRCGAGVCTKTNDKSEKTCHDELQCKPDQCFKDTEPKTMCGKAQNIVSDYFETYTCQAGSCSVDETTQCGFCNYCSGGNQCQPSSKTYPGYCYCHAYTVFGQDIGNQVCAQTRFRCGAQDDPLPWGGWIITGLLPCATQGACQVDNGNGTTSCFPAGTLISTPAGDVAIDKLKLGQEVFAVNDNNELVKTAVVGIIEKKSKLLELTTSGGILETTVDHPIRLFSGGFKQAGELKPGDELLVLKEQKLQPAKLLSLKEGTEVVPVFNLAVSSPNTFVASGFVVHNKGGVGSTTTTTLLPYYWKYCGDGTIDPGENCEGSNWGPIASCSDFDDYTGGILSCNPPNPNPLALPFNETQECMFNTTLCTGGNSGGKCGDGIINAIDEECDGNNWGPIMGCQDFDSWTGGKLSCNDVCNFDTTNCNDQNICPITDHVELSEPAFAGTPITARVYGWSDSDFDSTPKFRFQWYKNSVLINTSIKNTPIMNYPGTHARGDVITVKVRPYDNECFGNEVTDTLTVNNSPPLVNFLIDSPKTSCIATFNLNAAATDKDGDSLQYRFDFETDGIWDTGFSSSNSIQHSFSANGEVNRIYWVTVQVTDGINPVTATEMAEIYCDPTTLPCTAVTNLNAALNNNLNSVDLTWTVPSPNNITGIKICYAPNITNETDLSYKTKDFNCEWMSTPLSASATSWTDTNAQNMASKYYKIRTICSIAGFNPVNYTADTVGKYEIPVYKIQKNGMDVNDRFSIPLQPSDTNIYNVLKSLGKGRGTGNGVYNFTTCTLQNFVGNYSNVWEWDIAEYFASSKDSAAATRYYKSNALCPYYLSTTVYDLSQITTGNYYEILLSHNDTIVNVGKVVPSSTKQLYAGISSAEVRKSPFASTLQYNKSVRSALSAIGTGQGIMNENSTYSKQYSSCTGRTADNFAGSYTDVRFFDGKTGEWQIYNPAMPCPFYSQEYYKLNQIIPGEAYLVNMTSNKQLTFNHGN